MRRHIRTAFESLEPRSMLAARSLPTVSIADASIAEGDAGTRSLSFTVSLSSAATATTRVRYATSDGTAAVSGNDYRAATGTVTFTRGMTTATVSVSIRGDAAAESDETLRVILSRPTRCAIDRGTATGTITNDDSPPPPPATGSWTVLVFMTGGDLNFYAKRDIEEMEKALTTMPGSVRFVASWDQPGSRRTAPAFETGGGAQAAWRTYGRSVISADTDMTRIKSSFDLSFGEQNTGDPATLVDFVKWGVARAPADRYVLQMWGHGSGTGGSQFDTESGGDPLTIPEFAAALASPGMPRFDVVSYDNCLMSTVEIGAAIAPSLGGVFVASQDVVPLEGQDYTTAFATLAVNDPSLVTTETVAAGMVASYGGQYKNDWLEYDTFSATRATGYAGLTAAIREFVNVATSLDGSHRAGLREEAFWVKSYGDGSSRDLGGFMTNVSQSATLPPALRTAATGVIASLAATVSAKTNDQTEYDQRVSSGLSIFLPVAQNPVLADYKVSAAAFCAATGWDSFLAWLTASPS